MRLQSAEHTGNSALNSAGWLFPVAPAMEPAEENLWSPEALPWAILSLTFYTLPLGHVSEVARSRKGDYVEARKEHGELEWTENLKSEEPSLL